MFVIYSIFKFVSEIPSSDCPVYLFSSIISIKWTYGDPGKMNWIIKCLELCWFSWMFCWILHNDYLWEFWVLLSAVPVHVHQILSTTVCLYFSGHLLMIKTCVCVCVCYGYRQWITFVIFQQTAYIKSCAVTLAVTCSHTETDTDMHEHRHTYMHYKLLTILGFLLV